MRFVRGGIAAAVVVCVVFRGQSRTGPLINQDWQTREFVESVQLNILKITDFLNRFDTSTRYRLAKINEKLSTLERSLEFLEAAVRSSAEGADE